MVADLDTLAFLALAALFLLVGCGVGVLIGTTIFTPSARRGRWGFDWQEESTKRGVARIVGALAALLAARQGAEAAAVTLAVSEFLVGLLGAGRTEQ